LAKPEADVRRDSRIQTIVSECIRMRVEGGGPTNQQLLAEHADLLPELGEALRKLALIEAAEQRFGSSESVFAMRRAPELPSEDHIPGYEIIDEIHRGGQGVVYRALQKSTRRTVAIKIMHEGPFAGLTDRARFEREIQILGRFKHPSIVAIHDSGQAADCAFFVMDYIEGAPLDEYIARDEQSVAETLRLFAEICDAVNAAHLRGVIHRDLKPGNIRVDSSGRPHVLDFGLARVVDDSEVPLAFTVTGQFIGSLQWASPEQAEGARDRIDMRTDVYSLGVILYQMLTGRFPYSVTGNVRDVVDRILREEPIRPRTLRRQINDEVETIVLKCLAKERERRYQTAGELTRDIRHYLAGEPIEAKRDSAGYVLGKHLRRYKLPLAIVAGYFLIVTVGCLTSLTFWRIAADERDDAQVARQAETGQREAAQASADKAEKEAAKARAVVRFLTRDLLAAADPGKTAGRQITVKEALDIASEKIGGAFNGQPLVEAEIRHTLGGAYLQLGEYDSAQRHLLRALDLRKTVLGEENWDTLDSVIKLAVLYSRQGRYSEAEPLNLQAYETYRRILGDDHRRTLSAARALGMLYLDQGRHAEAEPLLARAMRTRRGAEDDDHPRSYDAMSGLAALYIEQGRYVEAEPLYAQVLAHRRRKFGDKHTQTFVSLGNLAAVYLRLHHYAEAEPLCVEALQLSREIWGSDHHHTVSALTNLAVLYARQGRPEDSEVMFKEILEVRRRKFGDAHPETIGALLNLAECYSIQARLEEAESLLLQSVECACDVLGREHPLTLSAISNLGAVYNRQGRYEEAEPLLVDVLETKRAVLGPEHPSTLVSQSHAGTLYANQERYAEAEAMQGELLDIRRRVLGSAHPRTLSTEHDLAELFCRQKRYDQAEPLLAHALASRIRELGEEHPETIKTMNTLVRLYKSQGRSAEALHYALAAYRATACRFGRQHKHASSVAAELAELYESLGDDQQADRWRNNPPKPELLEERPLELLDEAD